MQYIKGLSHLEKEQCYIKLHIAYSTWKDCNKIKINRERYFNHTPTTDYYGLRIEKKH